jgi:DNA-binding NarL/FixJ family response regulator
MISYSADGDRDRGSCCCDRDHLTHREIEVLVALAAGHDNSQIAEELCISRATVAHHVAVMLQRAGAANRTALVSWAIYSGLLSTRQWPLAASTHRCLTCMPG